jgi:hypothetical protein
MKRVTVQRRAKSSTKSYSEALIGLRINLRVTSGRLEEFMALLKLIFSDENFITLLEVERFITMPNCVARRLDQKM